MDEETLRGEIGERARSGRCGLLWPAAMQRLEQNSAQLRTNRVELTRSIERVEERLASRIHMMCDFLSLSLFLLFFAEGISINKLFAIDTEKRRPQQKAWWTF